MKVAKGILLGVLLGLSYIDIRMHQVPVNVLRAGGAAVLLYQIFFSEVFLWEFLSGVGAGILFLLLSRVTKEGMGYGDSWGILILGGFLGFKRLLTVLVTAFFLLAIAAVILLSRKKMTRKCSIAFFPFLTSGYIVLLFTEGGIL